MKRFTVVSGLSMLAIGLAVGIALAAAGPGGGPGGPGGMRPGGPPPGGPGMGGGQFAPGEPHPGGPGGPGMQHQGPPPLIAMLEHKLGKPLTETQRGQVHEAGNTQLAALKPLHDAFVAKLAGITGLPVEKLQELLPPGPPPHDGQGPGMGGGKGRPPEGGPAGGPGKGGPGKGGPGKGGPGKGGPGMGGPGQGGPGMGGPMPPPPGAMLAKRLEQILGKPLTKEQLDQFREAEKAHVDAVKPVHEAFVSKLAGITGLSADDVKELPPRRGPPPPHGPPPGPPQGPPQSVTP